MSESNILDLIKNTPVEWRTLTELGALIRGNGLPKSDFTETGAPAIHYGQIYTHYDIETDKTISYVSKETAKKLRKVNKGDVILTNTSENIEDVGKALLYSGKVEAVTGGHATIFKPSSKILGKYLVYITQSRIFYNQKRKLAKGAKVIDVSTTDMHRIIIPVPSLAIQQKTIRILDAMTALISELASELTMRRDQYNHYRELLLTFNRNEIQWKTLNDISKKISSGGTPLSTRDEFYGGDIPWLRTQEVCFNEILDTEVKITDLAIKESSAKWIPANCVIIAISGATAGRSAINKIPLTTNQHCCNLEIDETVANYKYVFHWVSHEYKRIKSLGQGARRDLNAGIIRNYPIAIPPLEEQASIVAILDKFDALTTSISDGLPREIELRRKQYEYYRELLLNFPRPEQQSLSS